MKNAGLDMGTLMFWIIILTISLIAGLIIWLKSVGTKRRAKDYERALKMTPMLIHLPPSTDDIQGGGRDERDVVNEAISAAQVMYSILASTLAKKNMKTKIYGQKHFSFEIMAMDGFVKYYVVVPAVLRETVKQAVLSAYGAARLEELDVENIFAPDGDMKGVAGGEIILKKEFVYPIATYEDMKWDGQTAILNAFSKVKKGEGMGLQILFRPADDDWIKKSKERVQNIKDGKKGFKGSNVPLKIANFLIDVMKAPFEVPEEHKYDKNEDKPLSQPKQEEIAAIENKTKFPAFESLIRVVASSTTRARSE
ncbi:MAG: ATP-binding protein, partial [Candidatus Saccharibacteria bacterium]|nr:ATP-binding protein [Candidatus Saccharibacteria bacterium]